MLISRIFLIVACFACVAAIVAIIAKNKKPDARAEKVQVSSSGMAQYLTAAKDVVLITASTNIGVGLWTSICVAFAGMMGVESKNYTKKMERAAAEVKRKLIEQMDELPDYEYSDFRLVKEKGLVYSGSVIGVKKK